MNCKFCQAEMEEELTICPSCGKDNSEEVSQSTQETVSFEDMEAPVSEAEEPETIAFEGSEALSTEEKPNPKPNTGKIVLVCTAIIAVLAILVTLVFYGVNKEKNPPAKGEEVVGTVPEDGNSDDVTCKGSYSVSDKKAKRASDKVVATADGVELTNGELQVYYWMMFYNFMSSGNAAAQNVNVAQPLDTQVCALSQEGWTWQQYFLEGALTNWHMYYALCREAEVNSVDLKEKTDAYLESVKTNIEQSATQNGYKSADEMIRNDMGPSASLENYLNYTRNSYMGYSYYNTVFADVVPTQDQIEAYYNANEAIFAGQGISKETPMYINVRHILLKPEGGTTDESGATVYSDAEWEACEKAAQAVLDTWLKGEKTEDSFAELANEHSTDPGSNTKGGLYEFVTPGQMVQPFNDWCFDTTRKTGDYGLVKTNYGYHVMYMCPPLWERFAYDGARNQLINEQVEAIVAKYPAEIDYSEIVLGEIAIPTAS